MFIVMVRITNTIKTTDQIKKGLEIDNRQPENVCRHHVYNKGTVIKTGKDKTRSSGVRQAKARGPGLLPPCSCTHRHH